MSYYKDLREYLKVLETKGKLRVVHELINKDTELAPLVRWQFNGLPETDRTGFLFEKLTDVKGNSYNSRVATSIIGASKDVYALAMQCEPGDIHKRWRQAYQNLRPPKMVPTGPVKEEIHKGESLLEHRGLYEFAIPISTNGWEPLPRLTAVSWHTKDPDTGVINIGTYNGYMMGPDRATCRSTHGHIIDHWNKCRQRGIPLQAAAVLGGVPAISMVSVTRVPYGTSELNVAGG